MKNQSLYNSKRAQKGKLWIASKHCPYCGHDRFLEGGTPKCSKCKRSIGEE